MIAYIRGKIAYTTADSCIVDVQGIGYQVYVPHPYELTKDEDLLLYTFHYIKEDIDALYGFLTLEEKSIYIKLLSVKGIGPKVAMAVLSATNPQQLLQAIEESDVAYLKKIPGIGPKAAGQIIFDLKGKLVTTDDAIVPELKEAGAALTALGYTKKEIDFAFKHVEVAGKTVEDMVKLGLKNLMG